MTRNPNVRGTALNKPENRRCSICGGPRRAIYPSGQPHKLSAYLWCPVCDGSTIDVPKTFLDRKDK